MFTDAEIVDLLDELQVTHVVGLPDSTLGPWLEAVRAAGKPRVVSVCREGEAWVIAAGLFLGGARPLVMIQCTGLFESGDSLRNVLHDYKIPLFAFIGYRSYLSQASIPNDSALAFTEPILNAWQIESRLIDEPAKRPEIIEHYRDCQRRERPGCVMIAEGRG